MSLNPQPGGANLREAVNDWPLLRDSALTTATEV